MTAMPHARTAPITREADGLVLAPVDEGGAWHAVRELRSAMQELRVDDRTPRAQFLVALDRGGRMLPARDPQVAVLILGFRFGARRSATV
jgi:pyrimidine operon attenuation protein/uracil phosphoribosyltransferase